MPYLIINHCVRKAFRLPRCSDSEGVQCLKQDIYVIHFIFKF